jgi:tRNA(Ile)-lysidine synthase
VNLKSRPDSAFSPAALTTVLTQRLGIPPGSPLKVAFSGGLDSHVLLHALCALRGAHSLSVTALHVDHGLQPASSDWARHCRDVCRTLDVPLIVERVTITRRQRDGVEAAARNARYTCLERHVGPDEVMLTAHHQDDQAETLVLQLLRGAGVHGLASMPECTKFSQGLHIRPLLGFSRAQLAAYARTAGLSWIEDASNLDIRLARNFLRHRVIPLLSEHWPSATQTLARSARHAGAAAEILEEIAVMDIGRVESVTDGSLAIPPLLALTPARRRNAVRHWLRRRNMPMPSEKQLVELLRVTERVTATRHAIVRWAGACVERYRDRLLVQPEPGVPVAWTQQAWDLSVPLDIAPTRIRLRSVPRIGEGIAVARLTGHRITVRPRRGGEVCELQGRGHHRKLKKLLQEAGVTPWERARLPLLYVDETLAAVADRWVCAPFAARPGEPSIVLVMEPVPECDTKPEDNNSG